MQATLLTLAIAAILALLAALLGPLFVDWNAHRATFEQQASQAIGLPVRVTGPMDVRLLPSPSLVLTGVEIGKPGDAQALRAKALGIEFALPPLLSGKLQAVELRLIALEIRVSLDEDGRALLPNALSGLNTQPLSIDKLVIEDASLQFNDAASGTSATLTKLWFNGEVRALPGPIRGEGAFVMDGALHGYRIATARPEANGSRIKLTIDPADRPIHAEAEGLIIAAEGAPRFEGTAMIARRAPAKADRDAQAEPWRITARVKANAGSALFEQVEYQYGPEDRALKLHGTAEAKFGARPRLDAVLTARTLDADKLFAETGGAKQPPRAAIAALVSAAERIMGPPIPTQVGFGIDALTLGGASLQNIRGDVEFGRGQMTLTAFEARAPGFTQMQASGRIEKSNDHLSFAGPVSVSSTDPRIFADWLDGKSGSSALPARPIRLRGDLKLGSDMVAIERMHAEFDHKTFDGDLSYAFAQGAEPAGFTAALQAEELDLDALMDTAGSLKALPDTAQPHDVSLSLSTKRLRFSGLDADGAKLQLSLKSGALAIDTLAVDDLAGLAIDGKGAVDMQARRGSIEFNVAVRNSERLAAFAKRAPAILSEPLQRAAQTASPGTLAGAVRVEPAGGAGASRATISLEGPLGPVELKLQTALTGQWGDPAKADLSLDASFNAADVNALLRFAAAERMVSVPRQPGSYTLSVKGKVDGDMTIDTRVVSANLDARASGTIRPFADDTRRAALDIAIGRADVIHEGAAKPVPVAAKARLLSDALGLRLDDVSANVAGSALRGRLSLAFGEVPTIDGEVRADTIDVTAVLATASGLARSGKSETRWSEAPFALPVLPKLSGRVNVSAAQARLSPSLQVAKFRSALRFADGDLSADDIAGELLGGRLSGEVTVRRAADALSLQGRIAVADADATQLLFGDGAAPLTGQAALTLQFEGMGRSPRALVGSLNGTGTLVLDGARIASLDPNMFAAAMRSVDQGLPIDAPRVRDLASRGLDAGPLVVPHADVTLTIAAGVARIDTFNARAETADLAVTGSYDFSDARIDLRLAMAGPSAGASLQPEVAVQLRGPAAKPERVLDVSALTGWLALRSVDRQTKKIEAIEQGRPVAPEPPQKENAPKKPEAAVTPPERKPQQPVAQPSAQPLPPAVEINPAPGDRRGVLPQQQQQQQRAEPQRPEPQRPAGANPFPTPIGTPRPLSTPPVRRPFPPQTVRPIF